MEKESDIYGLCENPRKKKNDASVDYASVDSEECIASYHRLSEPPKTCHNFRTAEDLS